MGPEPFFPFAGGDCDLYMCYDYRELALPDLRLFTDYEQVDLFAWSMGVWVAAYLFADNGFQFFRTTALAGTLQPIDDQTGIPVAAFEGSIRTLDATRLDAFYSSMFDEREQWARFSANRPHRSVSSVREELINLHHQIVNTSAVRDIFNRKFVTSRDRVFPARNQVRSWGKEACIPRKWPHFPFYMDEFRQMIVSSSDLGRAS